MGRILALDYGSKRIGAALSDETKTISQPRPYFLYSEKEKLIEYVKENEVEEILLGLPIGLAGQETESSKKVREFETWLKERTNLPIRLIDERFSTKEIRHFEKDRELVDSLVAQKMLEGYLEANRNLLKHSK